mmetsp:Transcript_1301/g.2650  ORF Transcript_1301/g.2650 Transcript_1301/m.2650 type:complete len:349 (+) Transcript_1301:48-1094(+)
MNMRLQNMSVQRSYKIKYGYAYGLVYVASTLYPLSPALCPLSSTRSPKDHRFLGEVKPLPELLLALGLLKVVLDLLLRVDNNAAGDNDTVAVGVDDTGTDADTGVVEELSCLLKKGLFPAPAPVPEPMLEPRFGELNSPERGCAVPPAAAPAPVPIPVPASGPLVLRGLERFEEELRMPEAFTAAAATGERKGGTCAEASAPTPAPAPAPVVGVEGIEDCGGGRLGGVRKRRGLRLLRVCVRLREREGDSGPAGADTGVGDALFCACTCPVGGTGSPALERSSASGSISEGDALRELRLAAEATLDTFLFTPDFCAACFSTPAALVSSASAPASVSGVPGSSGSSGST